MKRWNNYGVAGPGLMVLNDNDPLHRLLWIALPMPAARALGLKRSAPRHRHQQLYVNISLVGKGTRQRIVIQKAKVQEPLRRKKESSK
jgi:hypothetical protein